MGPGMRPGSPPSFGTTGSASSRGLPVGKGIGLALRRERRGGGDPLALFGPVWPRLLLSSRLEMRPGWPRLAHRSLLRGRPVGPGWPHHRLARLVAEPLIQLHLVASCRKCPGAAPSSSPGFQPSSNGRLGAGMRLGLHPHPSLLPSREKGPDRLRGNDGGIRVNDACRQCKAGATMGQWAVVVGWGAPLHVQRRDSMRSMLGCLDTISSALLHWPTRHVVAQAPHHLS